VDPVNPRFLRNLQDDGAFTPPKIYPRPKLNGTEKNANLFYQYVKLFNIILVEVFEQKINEIVTGSKTNQAVSESVIKLSMFYNICY
jgi:hypothetical protein